MSRDNRGSVARTRFTGGVPPAASAGIVRTQRDFTSWSGPVLRCVPNPYLMHNRRPEHDMTALVYSGVETEPLAVSLRHRPLACRYGLARSLENFMKTITWMPHTDECSGARYEHRRKMMLPSFLDSTELARLGLTWTRKFSAALSGQCFRMLISGSTTRWERVVTRSRGQTSTWPVPGLLYLETTEQVLVVC